MKNIMTNIWKIFVPVVLTVPFFIFYSFDKDNDNFQDSAPLFKLEDIKEITSGEPLFTSPRWSPNGKKIACALIQSVGIFVMDEDGSDLKKLTIERGSGSDFRWINNAKIAYRATEYGYGRAKRTLKVINVNSGNIKSLKESEGLRPPKITPEGKIWAFDRKNSKGYSFKENGIEEKAGKTHKAYYISQNSELMESNEDGTEARVLIDNGGYKKDYSGTSASNDKRVIYFRISPDRSKIMFWQIRTMSVIELETGEVTNLGNCEASEWSPDSKYIIYQITKDGHYTISDADLFVIKADGTGKTQLTFSPDIHEIHPHWSPDGDKIVFEDSSTGKIMTAKIIKIN